MREPDHNMRADSARGVVGTRRVRPDSGQRHRLMHGSIFQDRWGRLFEQCFGYHGGMSEPKKSRFRVLITAAVRIIPIAFFLALIGGESMDLDTARSISAIGTEEDPPDSDSRKRFAAIILAGVVVGAIVGILAASFF
jgi:hypothetical protein